MNFLAEPLFSLRGNPGFHVTPFGEHCYRLCLKLNLFQCPVLFPIYRMEWSILTGTHYFNVLFGRHRKALIFLSSVQKSETAVWDPIISLAPGIPRSLTGSKLYTDNCFTCSSFIHSFIHSSMVLQPVVRPWPNFQFRNPIDIQ
jgi:hypothetical protein